MAEPGREGHRTYALTEVASGTPFNLLLSRPPAAKEHRGPTIMLRPSWQQSKHHAPVCRNHDTRMSGRSFSSLSGVHAPRLDDADPETTTIRGELFATTNSSRGSPKIRKSRSITLSPSHPPESIRSTNRSRSQAHAMDVRHGTWRERGHVHAWREVLHRAPTRS